MHNTYEHHGYVMSNGIDALGAPGPSRAPSQSQARAGSKAPRCANGAPRASRAAQFMPFAALTGYYELARQQERIVEPRHELTEEEAVELSRIMSQLKRGDLIRVTYYDWDSYRTVTGVVARIDTAYRRLQVVKTVIPFDDILSIARDARTCGFSSA
ncbi:MAG: YolD-like family protein [Coriobacteriaceae bacterium]|nr:YolD-like family protein [Coriobacteriaceae bacterium]